ncbi:MAG: hypothetical protein AB7H96_12485 [Vicinamibacterales bacterium]
MARCASDPCGTWRPDLLTGLSGVTIDERWFCSQACVERWLRRLISEATPAAPAAVGSAGPHLRLGALLRHHGALSADQLHEALEQQRTSGLRLGAQARALFGIDRALVLRALAAQAGTRYLTSIDPGTVQDAPGGLSREAIRALGLIPFSHPDRERVVRVASTAPIRWDAVNALRRLADWIPEPYLVEDDTWQELVEHYGSAVRSGGARPAPAEAVIVSGERAAIAEIATLVTSARRARLAEAHWEPFTLVRVQAEAIVKDVLFTRTAAEEASWQAASTLH